MVRNVLVAARVAPRPGGDRPVADDEPYDFYNSRKKQIASLVIRWASARQVSPATTSESTRPRQFVHSMEMTSSVFLADDILAAVLLGRCHHNVIAYAAVHRATSNSKSRELRPRRIR